MAPQHRGGHGGRHGRDSATVGPWAEGEESALTMGPGFFVKISSKTKLFVAGYFHPDQDAFAKHY
jgi:hypothetical protein